MAYEISFKRLLTVEETGIYLGLSPRTIYNAIAPKSKNPFPVKPRHFGRSVRFDVHDLDRFVNSLAESNDEDRNLKNESAAEK